ncbi:M16 family metallopeptidase [Polluticaenibacter yanchengensis]|uniref:Pitrilysin family protein n=1 Tax=Polluticaenibacter yanchengensis TaxID=3014562 RepID=A0ABT4UFJ9_9BACT|nr:pitrilysin family protein [Chitinophagaceae bacterium LY-5]
MSIKLKIAKAAVFLTAITQVGYAQAPSIKFEKYQLPNGLKVILHQDNSVPVVAVSTLYHVGSKNEDTSRTGFAHFFEHLLFEGSENIKRGEFDKYITNAGGNNNANTSQDRTFYYELLPANQLPLGLWLESERLMHAKIDKIGVETQRQVVKEEKRTRMDNQPYGSFMTNMFSSAFKVHPYRWLPIGSMEHLDNAQLNEFIDFYKKFYIPNNCVLSIAGDINIPETKKMIEEYFAAIPKGKTIERPKIVEPPLGGEVRKVIEDNIQLPAVMKGYRAPAQGTDDYYAFSVLSDILSGGPSSRYNKILVDQKQEAVFSFSNAFDLEDYGIFINAAIASMGTTPEALEKSMDSIITDISTNKVGEREFQKVKNQIERAFVTANSSMAGIAESLANYETYFGDANLINTEIEKIRKVTPDDVLRVAKKYLTKDNSVVLYYVPKAKK